MSAIMELDENGKSSHPNSRASDSLGRTHDVHGRNAVLQNDAAATANMRTWPIISG